MPTVYLGIGSNLGDRHAAIEAARQRLAALPQTTSVRLSPIYETAPVGGPPDQGAFLNAAVELTTELTPDALLEHLQRIERDLGRPEETERIAWGPRVIDLDLLLYDNRRQETGALTLPHPHLHQRWFVLKPLADLAPDLRHPTLGRTIAALLDELEASGNE